MTAVTSFQGHGASELRTSNPRWLAARGVAAGAVLLCVPSFMTVRLMVGGELGRFPLLFFATHLIGAAALTRRSPLAQVVGRGIAWKVFICQAWVLALRATDGDLRPTGALLAVAPALALVLARPRLHGAHARAAFAPHASRALFLAAATASIASAVYAAPLALRAWTYGSPMIGAALTVLAAALVAQAAAVLRMRAWGVVLGAATALGMLFALLVGLADSSFAAITALPGLALAAALGAAWLRTPPAPRAPTVRIVATSGSPSQQGASVQMEAEDPETGLAIPGHRLTSQS